MNEQKIQKYTDGFPIVLKQGDQQEISQMRETNVILKIVINDDERYSLKILTIVKNLFSKQLPKMPQNHITRIVFDMKHQCIVAFGNTQKILGGACFEIQEQKNFAEIVFLAVKPINQKKGIGGKLIKQIQKYMQSREIQHLVTFADLSAISFFQKNGFTKIQQSNRNRWEGYLKGYKGGVRMECRISQMMNYVYVKDIINEQKLILKEKIRQFPWFHKQFQIVNLNKIKNLYQRTNNDGKPQKFQLNPFLAPGIQNSGWQWNDYQNMNKSLRIEEILHCHKILQKMKSHHSLQSLKNVMVNEDSQASNSHYRDTKLMQIKLVNNHYSDCNEFSKQVINILKNSRKQLPSQRGQTNSSEIQDYIKPYLKSLLPDHQKQKYQEFSSGRSLRKHNR